MKNQIETDLKYCQEMAVLKTWNRFTESWYNYLEVDEGYVENESCQNEEQRVDVLHFWIVNDRPDD